MKRVSFESDNSTLRFYANIALRSDATDCLSQSVPLEYAVWLPLRVFKKLARFARSLGTSHFWNFFSNSALNPSPVVNEES